MSSGDMLVMTPLRCAGDYLVDGLLCCSLAVLVILYLRQRAARGEKRILPPGPYGLPVVGYLPFLNPRRPYESFCKLRKRYGDVFRLRMGSQNVVVMNGKKVMREAFLRHSEAFAGRPDFLTMQSHCKGESLAFGTFSHRWRLHHKLALQAIAKVLHHPDNVLESCTNAVAERIVDRLLEHATVTPVNPCPMMKSSGCDIILRFCFGKDATLETDGLCKSMIDTLHELVCMRKMVQALDIMPWTAAFLIGKLRNYVKLHNKFDSFTEQKIQEVLQQTENDDDEDQFKTAVQALNILSKTSSSQMREMCLTKEHLLHSVEDFIGASADTLGNYPSWMLLYMCYFPDIQARVQEEIDGVLGRGGHSPTEDDRSRMPYTEAVLIEIARHSGLMPLSIPHNTTKDVQIDGYTIPKDTMVFANFYSQSHDPELWSEPESFNPENFLTSDGAVDRAKVEQFPMFGYGKRRCIGEQVGKTVTFLMFVNMMRSLTVRPDPETPLPPIGSGSMEITMEPEAFKILVEDRTIRRSHAG